jgi:hypothetical protein
MESAGRASSLRVLPWHLSYNGKKALKYLSQGSHTEYIVITIKIHKLHYQTRIKPYIH